MDPITIYQPNSSDSYNGNDIPYAPIPTGNDSRFGSDIIRTVQELQVGMGSTVFRANKSGIWLGGATFASAPFSVDMSGHMIATSITLSGYIPTGGAASDVNSNATTINGGQITTNTITASKLNVATLSAISANIGTVTAGSITGVTITGGTVQTSGSGLSVRLNGSNSKIEFVNSSSVYGSAYTYAGGSNIGITIETFSASSGGQLILNEGTGFNYAFMGFNGRGVTADYQNSRLTCDYNTVPSSDVSYDLGGSSLHWRNMYLNSVGEVTSGGSAGTPFPSGWSVSHTATGRYTVTHNFGTTNYAVIVNPVVSIAKVWAVESKNSNNFVVRIANTSFTLEDNAFDFMVIRN